MRTPLQSTTAWKSFEQVSEQPAPVLPPAPTVIISPLPPAPPVLVPLLPGPWSPAPPALVVKTWPPPVAEQAGERAAAPATAVMARSAGNGSERCFTGASGWRRGEAAYARDGAMGTVRAA